MTESEKAKLKSLLAAYEHHRDEKEEPLALAAGCLVLLILVSAIFAAATAFGGLVVWAVWDFAAAPLCGSAVHLTYWRAALLAAGASFAAGLLRKCFR